MLKSKLFHRFLFVFFRLFLLPLLIYGIFVGDMRSGLVGLAAMIHPIIAYASFPIISFTELFPSALRGAGVPLIFVVGKDLAFIAVFVLCLWLKTPEIKCLGLGKRSGGAYWKGGLVSYWFLAAYVASAYFITQYMIDEKAEFYIGKFSVSMPSASGTEELDPGVIRIKDYSGDNSEISFNIGNHLCGFSVRDRDIEYNPGDESYKFPPFISSTKKGNLMVKLAEREPIIQKCATVEMGFIDAHSAFVKFADGVTYRIDRHADMESSYRSLAEKRYNGFLNISVDQRSLEEKFDRLRSMYK